MILLKSDFISNTPKLKKLENRKSGNIKIHHHLYSNKSDLHFFISEFDGDDTFYGYVQAVNEFRFFRLSELNELSKNAGSDFLILDRKFKAKKFKDIVL